MSCNWVVQNIFQIIAQITFTCLKLKKKWFIEAVTDVFILKKIGIVLFIVLFYSFFEHFKQIILHKDRWNLFVRKPIFIFYYFCGADKLKNSFKMEFRIGKKTIRYNLSNPKCLTHCPNNFCINSQFESLQKYRLEYF